MPEMIFTSRCVAVIAVVSEFHLHCSWHNNTDRRAKMNPLFDVFIT